jgi:putative flippase GtrA
MNGVSGGVLAGPVRVSFAGQMRAFLTGTFARYLSASVVALGADAGSFLALLHMGVAPASTAALGFVVGIVVNWVVSSRVLFADCVAETGPERRRQQVLFLVSALVGLVLTTAIVAAGASLMIDPRLAKLVAVGVSFVTTSGMRHVLVFTRARLG